MIELITGLYAGLVASFFFWPVTFVIFGLLCWSSESEEFIASALLTAGLVVLIGSKVDFSMMFASPLSITLMIIGYVVVGIIWAFVKWYLKARKSVRMFMTMRDKYLSDNNLPLDFFKHEIVGKDAETHHKNFASKIYNSDDFPTARSVVTAQDALESIKIKISNHKRAFCMWMAYWPVSMVWFALSDLVREIAETIYDAVSSTLQKMSDRMYKDIL